jgi:hypothetical protein
MIIHRGKNNKTNIILNHINLYKFRSTFWKMSVVGIPYKPLEEKVLDTKNIQLVFKPVDRASLRLGLSGYEGKSKIAIDVVMPWGNLYNVGEYVSREIAKKDFDEYSKQLDSGYKIQIINGRQAMIVKD